MSTIPADAKTIAVGAAGFVLIYSGVKGLSISTTFRDLLTGKDPSKETPTDTIHPTSTTSSTPVEGPSVSGGPIHLAHIKFTSKGNIPAQVSSGPRITKAFETIVLKYLKAPLTKANYDFLTAWSLREGNGGANNPFNTTESSPGATDVAGTPGVKNYTSLAAGALATAKTFANGDYNDIVAALRTGHISRDTHFQGLSTWSGGGYSDLAGIPIPAGF